MLDFLTKPSPKLAEAAEQLKKKAHKAPATTVEHLDERNDYTPPHSQLTQTFCGGINVYAAPFGASFE